ncbi:hypothetical protein GS504_01570 [Rhodococcus hoagii]|nr:hypothetical protein [Prescottella equi]NKS71638.1 hypothetical protein [Prescottella equi]
MGDEPEWNAMDVEIVRDAASDLIARTADTHRRLAAAPVATAPDGPPTDHQYLRLMARAYAALADAVLYGLETEEGEIDR